MARNVLLIDVLKNRSDRFNYVVLCLVEGGVLAEALDTMGIPVIIFGRSSAFDISLLFRLARWLRKNHVAVVHTHLFTADSWGRVAALMARVQGIFSTIHSVNSWKGQYAPVGRPHPSYPVDQSALPVQSK